MNSSSGRISAAAPAHALRMVALLVAVLPVAGCKTDLNQQLLERELRMQEDQIYLLQDELQSKGARLERAVGENSSLKRQLGIGEKDPTAAPRAVPPGATSPARSAVPPPMFVPPPRIPQSVVPPPVGAGSGTPGGPRFTPPGGAAPFPPAMPSIPSNPLAPPALVPPSLDGVPPLPGPTGARLPSTRRLSYEESLDGEGQITHLVLNPSRTECFDGDGDGVADGLAVVVEPRDADERLVSAAGDIVVSLNDPALPPGSGAASPLPTDPGEGGCLARWDIPEAEAMTHFRRTTRNRGLHFVLRWPGPPPQSPTVHVHVVLTTFDGTVHHVDGPVPIRSPLTQTAQ